MTNKKDLAEKILEEVAKAQVTKPERPKDGTGFWLPPQLPLGDGRFLPATEDLFRHIASFGEIVRQNQRDLPETVVRADLDRLLRQVFARAVLPLDFDDPPEQTRDALLGNVAELLRFELGLERIDKTFVFGSWFLSGETGHDCTIGPVRLEDRMQWVRRAKAEALVSPTTARRLEARWEGNSLRRRKPSSDEDKERGIAETIGDCPAVTSVRTSQLATLVAEDKAILAARLAHAVIALFWQTPSKALAGLNLLVDGGPLRRHHFVFAEGGGWSSSTVAARPAAGPHANDWPTVWNESQWLVEPMGRALTTLVDPPANVAQPALSRTLLLALWWFQSACREEAPVMATVKFAASLDALAGGGKARGIVRLIEARLGLRPGAPLTADGRSTSEIVSEIYDYARSRTLHGGNDKLGHDWGQARSLAENLARMMIRTTCGWMTDHPNEDDVRALMKHETH